MKSVFTMMIVLLISASVLSISAVNLLYGTPWAMLTGAAILVGFAVLLRQGMMNG